MQTFTATINPCTPKSDQFSPAASPEILHHTVWSTWLSWLILDERLLYYQFHAKWPQFRRSLDRSKEFCVFLLSRRLFRRCCRPFSRTQTWLVQSICFPDCVELGYSVFRREILVKVVHMSPLSPSKGGLYVGSQRRARRQTTWSNCPLYNSDTRDFGILRICVPTELLHWMVPKRISTSRILELSTRSTTISGLQSSTPDVGSTVHFTSVASVWALRTSDAAQAWNRSLRGKWPRRTVWMPVIVVCVIIPGTAHTNAGRMSNAITNYTNYTRRRVNERRKGRAYAQHLCNPEHDQAWQSVHITVHITVHNHTSTYTSVHPRTSPQGITHLDQGSRHAVVAVKRGEMKRGEAVVPLAVGEPRNLTTLPWKITWWTHCQLYPPRR